jgi:hypothetical protein
VIAVRFGSVAVADNVGTGQTALYIPNKAINYTSRAATKPPSATPMCSTTAREPNMLQPAFVTFGGILIVDD